MCFLRTFHFKKIDSTSAFIKRRRFPMSNLTFVSSNFQTNGRGRTGRKWQSEKNENLLFSFLVKDKKIIENFGKLSLLTAYSVIELMNSLKIKNVSYKWPNDVFVDGKKVCGILLEGVSKNNKLREIIVGVGFNVNQTEFKGDYIVQPTSLKLEKEKDFNINEIKKSIYRIIKKNLKLFKENKLDFIKYLRKINFLKNKVVFAEIDGIKEEITVLDINNDCSLRISTKNGVKNINSGEISFHV